MSPLVGFFLLQLEQGISIDTDSPDAHCPNLHQTREAVSARLGAVEGAGFHARYTIVHERGEVPKDFVLLELTAPDGEVRLRRRLPVGESCASVAEAIALVLDQYFRAVVPADEADESASRAAAPPPQEAGVVAAPAETASQSDAAGTSDSRAPTPQSAPSWLVMADVAAVSFPETVAPGLRLQLLPSPSWHAGLGLVAPLGERSEELLAGGTAKSRAFELNLHAGFGPDLGAVRPYVGPTLFMVFERGYSTPPLESTTQHRVLGGAAGEVGLDVRIGGRFRTVVFAAGGGIFAQSSEFVVAGREVLNGLGWVMKAGIGLAHVF
jgi:hypothetical protein